MDWHRILLTVLGAGLAAALGGGGAGHWASSDKAPQYEVVQAKSEMMWLYGKVGELEARLQRLEYGALP